MSRTRTLSRVVFEKAREFPNHTGELSELLTSIALGVMIISQMVASAPFSGTDGLTGRTNVHDEATKILDERADQVLVDILGSSGHFGLLVSEERDSVVATNEYSSNGKYVVAFDPLDGSSNIGSNIPVGTIFTIFSRKDRTEPSSVSDFLQPGLDVVAAGYSIYGATTSFVYSTGAGVLGFTLDPSIGEFILTEESIKIPDDGHIISVNEGNWPYWSESVQNYLLSLKSEIDGKPQRFTYRYVGSLVSDFDRTIRKGGIFLYPPSRKHPHGRLRLLYECVPLAFIAEQAGGIAIDGSISNQSSKEPAIRSRRVTAIMPTSIHEKCGLVVGGPTLVRGYLDAVTHCF